VPFLLELECFTVLPGCSASSIVAPGWPFGLPGLRPDLPRSDFGDGFAGPSDDGGFDEFREFVFTWAARSATSGTAERCHDPALPANRQASKRLD
jgi:hypothetical protein